MVNDVVLVDVVVLRVVWAVERSVITGTRVKTFRALIVRDVEVLSVTPIVRLVVVTVKDVVRPRTVNTKVEVMIRVGDSVEMIS